MGDNPSNRCCQDCRECEDAEVHPFWTLPVLHVCWIGGIASSGDRSLRHRLDLLKYNYTPDPDPDQYTSPRSDLRPSLPTWRSNQKPSNCAGSSQSQDIWDEGTELTQQEIDDIANSFINAIRWMEIAKTSYEHMGNVVADVCKALGNINIRDIDTALTRIARKQDMVEWDAQIARLIREKGELEAWLAKREVDFEREEAKTKGAQRLLGLLEEHVYNIGDVVTKARLYDEAMAKTGTITSFKLIHICVDYSTKMEAILAEMRSLFSAQNQFFSIKPTPLDKVPDLAEFPNLSLVEVLQGLHMLTTLQTNPKFSGSKLPKDLGSDTRSKDVAKIQGVENVQTLAPETTPPLLMEPTPTIPPPLAPSPGQMNPLPN